MSEKIIEVSNISKFYGRKQVLRDISLSINRKEIFGLLGPNAAGKSSLLNILVGLLKKSSGEINFFGSGLDATNKEIKKRIAFTPQDESFFFDFTVEKNLQFFASLYGLDSKAITERVDSIISLLQLEEFRKHKARFLSGGFKRLLNLGCSLVNDPEIIFLDEPTVGLDPKMRRLIWQKLNNLREENKTIVITTHYMEEAEELCDRIALVNNGEIIAVDTPDALIEKYGGTRILVLNLDKKFSAEHLDILRKAIPDSKIELYGLMLIIYFKQKHSLEKIAAITKWIAEKGYDIKHSIVREPNLEDVFLTLTGKAIR